VMGRKERGRPTQSSSWYGRVHMVPADRSTLFFYCNAQKYPVSRDRVRRDQPPPKGPSHLSSFGILTGPPIISNWVQHCPVNCPFSNPHSSAKTYFLLIGTYCLILYFSLSFNSFIFGTGVVQGSCYSKGGPWGTGVGGSKRPPHSEKIAHIAVIWLSQQKSKVW